MILKNAKELGLSILEALIATAIMGIGFVAVFQMVNYSVRSIDVSGERTKTNYLVSMVAEDLLADAHTLESGSSEKFAIYLQNRPGGGFDYGCTRGSKTKSDAVPYSTTETDAPKNKMNKWANRLQTDAQIKCRSANDLKSLRIIKICRWDGQCEYDNDNFYDDAAYFGRMQINLNDGQKRKFLYFPIHYKIKQ